MFPFTGRKIYQQYFDPRAYLESYFHLGSGTMIDRYLYFVLKELVDTFKSGKVKGDTLIDIGTGPTIYQLLSACEVFQNIIVSDLTDRNREEFNLWLNNHPGAFDWCAVVKHVCHLERNRISCREKEERLRKSIKQVLKCNILKANPFDPVTLPQADCVLSCLCLEAACRDYDTLITAVKNITTLLKPGGYLVLAGVMGNPFFIVGEVRFSSLNVDEVLLTEAITGAGYVIENFHRYKKMENPMEDKDSFVAYYFIIARKAING
ncbi:nicotinamide N-methyltransferase-like [Leptodactylus fuscus]|uniref:nicotinamide N-methyltransferase-like n=1 Tax=Leptodactylus fuscus TaxID=238119 RepID=UPI003F4EC0AE